MNIKQIPLSKSEAWRLYSQGQDVRSVSDYRFYGKPLVQDLHYDFFNQSNKKWVLQLSEQDSLVIHKTCQKRGRKLIGSIYCLSTGMIFFMMYLNNTPSPKFTSSEFFLYGNGLILIGCYLLVSLLESLNQEEKAWLAMYEKFNISDWKNS